LICSYSRIISESEVTGTYRQKINSCCDDVMDRYTVIKQLGDGTFGSVILATDTETGEKVAIKK